MLEDSGELYWREGLEVYSGRGEAVQADQKSTVSETNNPNAAAVPLANTAEWCQAVLDDIEHAFREKFGARWSPEHQQVFQGLRESVMLAAEVCDEKFRRDGVGKTVRSVLLSNYLGASGRG